MSSGKKFRRLVAKRAPLQIPGAVNAYCALLAQRAGFEALYLSGAGYRLFYFGAPLRLAASFLAELKHVNSWNDYLKVNSVQERPRNFLLVS